MKINAGADAGGAARKVPIVLKLLILAPNPADAEEILKAIRHFGLEPNFTHVETEEDYLAKLDPRLDAIVIHHAPPRIDALKTLQKTRELAVDVPTIVVSAVAGEDVAVEAMREGAAEYLVKSKLDTLGRSIARAIESRSKLDEERRTRARLLKANELLRAIRNVNERIANERDPARLVAEACNILLRVRGYRFVWIGQIGGASKKIVPAASAGLGADLFDEVEFMWDDSPAGKGPTGAALKTRQASVCEDVGADPHFIPWRKAALTRGYSSAFAAPICHGERMYGALTVYAHQPNAFEPEEVRLLTDVARDLGAALKGLEDLKIRERAEKEPRQAGERFRAVVESGLDLVAVLDADLTLRYVNPAAEAMLGYKPEALIGRSGFEIIHPDDADLLRKKLKDAVQRVGASGAGEIRVRHSDGTWRTLDCVGRNLFSDQTIAGFVVTARDVTGRKRGEESHHAEEKSRALLESQRKAAAEELQKFRAELEERIDEKATELRAAKESLEKETSERKRLEKAAREAEENNRAALEAEKKHAEKAQREAEASGREALESERKRIEKETKEREEKLRAAFQDEGKRGEKGLRKEIAELEHRISERAVELRAVKESLDKEISERKRLEKAAREAEEVRRATLEAEQKRAEKEMKEREVEEKLRAAAEAERKRADEELQKARAEFHRQFEERAGELAALQNALQQESAARQKASSDLQSIEVMYRDLSEAPPKPDEEAIAKLRAEFERRLAQRAGELDAVNDSLRREADQRKQTEEALRQLEERYQHLLHAQTQSADEKLQQTCADLQRQLEQRAEELRAASESLQNATVERGRVEQSLRETEAKHQAEQDAQEKRLSALQDEISRAEENLEKTDADLKREIETQTNEARTADEALQKECAERERLAEALRDAQEKQRTLVEAEREESSQARAELEEKHKIALEKDRQRARDESQRSDEKYRAIIETERNQAQAALKELEGKHRAQFENERNRAVGGLQKAFVELQEKAETLEAKLKAADERLQSEIAAAELENERNRLRDELRRMEDNANAAIEAEHKRAGAAAQKMRAELEKQIEERDGELRAAAESLQKESAERLRLEKALQDTEENHRVALESEQARFEAAGRESDERHQTRVEAERKAADEALRAMGQKLVAEIDALRTQHAHDIRQTCESGRATLEAEQRRLNEAAEKTRAEFEAQIEKLNAQLLAASESLEQERAGNAALKKALEEAQASHQAALDAERQRSETALRDNEKKARMILESERAQAGQALQSTRSEFESRLAQIGAELQAANASLETARANGAQLQEALDEAQASHQAALDAERQRSETALRDNEEKARMILESERAQAGQALQSTRSEFESRLAQIGAELQAANASLETERANGAQLGKALEDAREEHRAALEAERHQNEAALRKAEEKNIAALESERARAAELLEQTKTELTQSAENLDAELRAVHASLQKESAERQRLEEAACETEQKLAEAESERKKFEQSARSTDEKHRAILDAVRRQAEQALQQSSAEIAKQVEAQISRVSETREALERETLERQRIEASMGELEEKHAAAVEAERARAEGIIRATEEKYRALLEEAQARAAQAVESAPKAEAREHLAEEQEKILAAAGIQKALAELEKRVEDLTAQLNSANASLQEQTSERQRLEALIQEKEQAQKAELEAERQQTSRTLIETEERNRSLLDIERRRAEDALRESRQRERSAFETERKRMEAALRSAEQDQAAPQEAQDPNERLRAVIQASPAALFVLDPDGRVVLWSPAAADLSGFGEKEVLGRRMALVPERKMGEFRALHERAVQGPVFDGVEAKRQRKDGSEIDVSISTAALRDSKGGIIGVLGVLNDITERKRAEKGLRESFTKLRESLESTLRAVALTVETKDPRTAGHQRRVSEIACAIAREVGLTDQQIEGLRLAGDIHDIGKISVPAGILSKPGPLNPFEFDIVKTHVNVGYEMLKSIDFPWPVAQMVLQHHERMNGSGYPQGLKQNDIILEARILAVADVVEAVSSLRLYRPLLGIDKALEEIDKEKGTLYDTQVVEACLRIFKDKKFQLD